MGTNGTSTRNQIMGGLVSWALVFLSLTASATDVGAETVIRGPYLQLGTPTSIVVRWRTDTPTDSRILFGAAPGNLSSSVEDLLLTTEHELTLSNLNTDTRYYYAVGTTTDLLAGDDPDHFFHTAPAAGTPRSTRIWVLGDSGTGNANAMLVRDAYATFAGAQTTHLWLMLGDNAYPSGTDLEYQATLFDIYPDMLRKSVLWPTIGNHDSFDVPTQTWPYFDSFTLPTQAEAGGLASGTEAYYSFDYANVHFVVLDSQTSDRTPGSAMLTWLEADLAATTQHWTVAYWHHPPYSKGSHDSDDAVVDYQLVEMRENALPILEDYSTDLILSGHSHSYERSFLIDGFYATPTVVPGDGLILDGGDGSQNGDGAYRKPLRGTLPLAGPGQGAVYTVAGNAGRLSGGPLNHPLMRVSFNLLGSVVLDIDAVQLDLTFLDGTGVVQDSFTIIKDPQDSDGDGVPDTSDNCPTVSNPSQTNSDGDNVGDACDNCLNDNNQSQGDNDEDGVGNRCDNCAGDFNPDQADGDGDGIGDVCDSSTDSDGDGVLDENDNCPTVSNSSQANSDGDNVGDACDNCPNDNNQSQGDTDEDGVGNHCDNCASDFNPTQADGDGDGTGDACDSSADSDGDGILDETDNCPTTANPSQTNSDGDNVGDACDNCPHDNNEAQWDNDGDGVGNQCDNCMDTFNPDQVDTNGDGIGNACDGSLDSDGDGILDEFDNCALQANPSQADTDGDGAGDVCDQDDDNDGVLDGLDCAALISGVSALPAQIGVTIHLDGAGSTTVSWSRGVQGHTSNVYRGLHQAGQPLVDLSCLVPETPTTDTVDSEVPPSGATFIYLVNARNGCGDGSAGQDGQGQERTGWVPCSTVNGDFELDGVPDLVDNCPLLPNAAQVDADLDFVGDVCDACATDSGKRDPGICGCGVSDADLDGDGVPDCVDNCPSTPNPNQADADADDIGDACENPSDTDGDGILNIDDNCPTVSNVAQANSDGDNVGDACDNCPDDNNQGQGDNDGDGIGNQCDNCTNTANPSQADNDADGLGDACDSSP